MEQVREIGRSYTVELAILSNTNTKFNFSDNETMLDGKIITGLSVLLSTVGRSFTNRPLLDYFEVAKGFITLADNNGKEFNKMLPLELFLRQDNIIEISPKPIALKKCYVDLPLIGAVNIPAGPPPGLAIMFTFFYQ